MFGGWAALGVLSIILSGITNSQPLARVCGEFLGTLLGGILIYIILIRPRFVVKKNKKSKENNEYL